MRIVFAALLLLSVAACSGRKTVELPDNEGTGSDYMKPSPCACSQIDFDSRGFEWIG